MFGYQAEANRQINSSKRMHQHLQVRYEAICPGEQRKGCKTENTGSADVTVKCADLTQEEVTGRIIDELRTRNLMET